MTALLDMESESAESARLIEQWEWHQNAKRARAASEGETYWRLKAQQREAEASWVYYLLGLLNGGEVVNEHIRQGLGGDPAARMEDGADAGIRDELRAIWTLLESEAGREPARARIVAVGKRLSKAIKLLDDALRVAREQRQVEVIETWTDAHGRTGKRVCHKWMTPAEQRAMLENAKGETDGR